MSRRADRRPLRGRGLDDYGLVSAPTRALANRWKADEGLTLTDTRVDAWEDSVGGQVFLPVTPATSEVFYVASHPGFRGKPVIQNNLSAATSRILAGTGADFKFLHDGTGGTVAWIAIGTSSIAINTNGGNATSAGANFRPSASATFRWRINNGTTTVIEVLVSGIASRSNPSLWVGGYKSADTPDAYLRRGHVVLGAANEAAAPTTGDAAQGLEIMYLVTTEVSTAELLLYDDTLTAAELRQLEQYAWQQYGVIV